MGRKNGEGSKRSKDLIRDEKASTPVFVIARSWETSKLDTRRIRKARASRLQLAHLNRHRDEVRSFSTLFPASVVLFSFRLLSKLQRLLDTKDPRIQPNNGAHKFPYLQPSGLRIARHAYHRANSAPARDSEMSIPSSSPVAGSCTPSRHCGARNHCY